MNKNELLLASMDQLIDLISILNSPHSNLMEVGERCEAVANDLLDMADAVAAARVSSGKSA